MEANLETVLDRIRQHVKVLNHSSERMASTLDELEDDFSELSQRMASVEAHLAWLMKLIWMVVGGIVMIVFRVFSET
jgi:chromosome segregation ATPase|tara:strand:- start:749 stop:979 length:231 start_codon:yes stop_codon:yes gene_type:complete